MKAIYIEQISATASPIVKGTRDSACWDLCADLRNHDNIKISGVYGHQETNGDLVLQPGSRALIPTGYKVCCDSGYAVELYPRSGISFKRGLTLNNCVGVIDADYRNELFVSITNNDCLTQVIKHGEPIAQMRLTKLQGERLVYGELPPTSSDRVGGFGSTDK